MFLAVLDCISTRLRIRVHNEKDEINSSENREYKQLPFFMLLQVIGFVAFAFAHAPSKN